MRPTGNTAPSATIPYCPGIPEDWYRAVRNFLFPIKYDKRDNRVVKHIRFVGVWDTVAAYGLPMDEMTRGVSRWIVPLELRNHTLNRKCVMRACQALALDEELNHVSSRTVG